MNRNIMGLFLIVTILGCSSLEAIYKNYKTVNFADGIDEPEAKVIAQKKLVNTEEQRFYRLTAPDIRTTPQAMEYPEYWFVVFGHNWLSPISMEPVTKTYTELREIQYLVVIHKKTGEVKFFGEWFPKRDNTFRWVFNPNAYKVGNPLALPPGKQSKDVFAN